MSTFQQETVETIEFERLMLELTLEGVSVRERPAIRRIIEDYVEKRVERELKTRKSPRKRKAPIGSSAENSKEKSANSGDSGMDPYLEGIMNRKSVFG